MTLKSNDNIIHVEPGDGGIWVEFQGRRQFYMRGTAIHEQVTKVISDKCKEVGFGGRGVDPDGRWFTYFGDISKIEVKENKFISFLKRFLWR
jgi:hypothetical protein